MGFYFLSIEGRQIIDNNYRGWNNNVEKVFKVLIDVRS